MTVTLIPPYSGSVITPYYWWDELWTLDELDKIVELCETFPKQTATVAGNVPNVRQSTVSWIKRTPESAWFFDRLAANIAEVNFKAFGFDLTGMHEDLQYTVYEEGGDFYGWHQDQGNQFTMRKLSLTLQLSNEYEYDGGDLQVDKILLPEHGRKRGVMHFFPSFVNHQVTPVTRGTRRSLVVWVGGPRFR